jgi:hypothetical protein
MVSVAVFRLMINFGHLDDRQDLAAFCRLGGQGGLNKIVRGAPVPTGAAVEKVRTSVFSM